MVVDFLRNFLKARFNSVQLPNLLLLKGAIHKNELFLINVYADIAAT